MAFDIYKAFNSDDKRRIRARLAQIYLDKKTVSWSDVEYRVLGEILGFFENLGRLVRARVAQRYAVWSFLGDGITHYYSTYSRIINEKRKGHEEYYENLVWLADQMALLDTKRRKKSLRKRKLQQLGSDKQLPESTIDSFIQAELALTELISFIPEKK